jgi:hypothetical protein
MSDTPRPEVASFLARFFSPPNQLHHDSKPEMRIWIERLAGSSEMLPTVLPCWRTGKIVDWYGLAFDDRQMNALGESLIAFIGPSYTTFRGQAARLDRNDPIDQAVDDLTAGRAYKFQGADPSEIWRALARMRKVWERRGTRERATPAPVGRVLRDFYMALNAGDASAAEAALTDLREHYHLDGVNLLYLRVQLLASFRRWADLLALPEIPDLLRLRRPVAVTEALLRAVYHMNLALFEDPPNPAGAAAAFRNEVASRFSFLLASRAGMRSPEAAKVFMLQAVSKAPPDLLLRDELLAIADLEANDLAYLKQIAALAGPAAASVPEGNPLALADEAARASDFDRAFTLATSAPRSLAQARLLCECAFELGTLEARAEAINAVSGLSDADRAEFLTRRVNQQLWDSLQEDVSTDTEPAEAREPRSVPTDWRSWLDYLDMHDGRNGAREIARRGADEWSVTEFLSQAGAAEQLAAKLASNRSQSAEHVLRDCLPHLLAFFQKDPAWPNPALKAVYRHLIDLLFYSTEGGRADLVLWNDLLEAALTLGTANATEYRDLITYLSELWARFAAPATLDWAIDAVAILILHPCVDTMARRSFFVALLDRLMTFLRHVEAEHWALLRLTAADLGEGDLFGQYMPAAAAAPPVSVDDPLAVLNTMSVAVYTLTESAGKQFKAVLESRTPGVRITLCHDLAATTRLKQLARQADLFLVAASSATHAATASIAANRPDEKPTLYPSGKGAASLLRAVRDHLQ